MLIQLSPILVMVLVSSIQPFLTLRIGRGSGPLILAYSLPHPKSKKVAANQEADQSDDNVGPLEWMMIDAYRPQLGPKAVEIPQKLPMRRMYCDLSNMSPKVLSSKAMVQEKIAMRL